MSITSTNAQYDAALARWARNRAALAGQDAVKEAGHLFLPDDSYEDKSKDGRSRYARYLARATWMPITGYSHTGLIGMIFRLPPTLEMPPNLEYTLENADGCGQSLTRLAASVCSELLIVGRAGILVDYPRLDGVPDSETEQSLGLGARLKLYLAENIDHWAFDFQNGKKRLTMVKLREVVTETSDDFVDSSAMRYRVLRLQDGVYTQTLHNDKGEILDGPIIPLMAGGVPFDHIPFQFIGANNNSEAIDAAPLSGIVDLNVTHYQMSADSAKNLHIHSGGLMVISSDMDTEQWIAANPNGVTVGADQGVFVGPGGSATLLQLESASAVEEKIKRLENQMLSVGAHLITDKGDNETAEAARIDASSKAASLLRTTDNASEAIEAALEDAALFMAADPNTVMFKLNRDFYPDSLAAQDVMALIQLQDRGNIAALDVRSKLRRAGWIAPERTDELIDESALPAELIAPGA